MESCDVELALSRVPGSDRPRGAVVGMDLRGTGYSTNADCAALDELDIRTDATLAACADEISAANRACVEADPAFLGSLTTANAARDLDAVRQAMGLATIDYLGVSWGTVLGAELQSRFPDHLHRLVLDSMDYTGTSAAAALRILVRFDCGRRLHL